MRTESGKKQRVRLKENKKATKKIDVPVFAFGAELTKDKEGELSWSVDGTRVGEWASMAAAQRKRRVRDKTTHPFNLGRWKMAETAET